MNASDIRGSKSCVACGGVLTPLISRIHDDRYGHPGEFEISKCATCRQMRTLPPLTEADLPALYSGYYPRKEVDRVALQLEANKALAPFASLRRWIAGTNNQGHYLARSGQSVLDVGSGSCLALLELRNMGVKALGVEADPNSKALADHFGLQLHIGSVHDDSFTTERFDLVVLNQVIEHVPDPIQLLAALRARLLPGGKVVLSFPNPSSFWAKVSGVRWINWHVPYHQHHFSQEGLRKVAERSGFTVESVKTITPNLWTLLQMRAWKTPPARGAADKIWSTRAREQHSAAEAQFKAPSFAHRAFRYVVRALLRRIAVPIARALLAVVNRLIDVTGWGDSFLVVLKPMPEDAMRIVTKPAA